MARVLFPWPGGRDQDRQRAPVLPFLIMSADAARLILSIRRTGERAAARLGLGILDEWRSRSTRYAEPGRVLIHNRDRRVRAAAMGKSPNPTRGHRCVRPAAGPE